MHPRWFAKPLLLVLVAVALVACSSAASSGSPGASSAGPSDPPTPSGGVIGPVTTPEQAVAAVVAANPKFAGIGPKDPDLIGQPRWYEVAPASGVGAFVVRFTVGWGDCPAGCIDKHTWTYAVGPDGTVTLQSEDGSPLPSGDLPTSDVVTSTTGVSIAAAAGPVCPVEKPNDPACAPRPVRGAIVHVVDAGGQVIGSAVTGGDGRVTMTVAPGDYTSTADPVEGLMGAPAPVPVTVVEGTVAPVDLAYDTGIR
jgi:hypothetical protein